MTHKEIEKAVEYLEKVNASIIRPDLDKAKIHRDTLLSLAQSYLRGELLTYTKG